MSGDFGNDVAAMHYRVTTCQTAARTLALLREYGSAYGLIMSDVPLPDMDGFILLEAIGGLELDLPVIMMSTISETEVVMKAITDDGACDCLLKPVRIEELRNIWKHVVRRRGRRGSIKDDHSGAWDETGRGLVSPSEGDTSCKKRKEELEQVNERLEDVKSVKKARIVWTVELHQQFLNAVNQLGIDNAHPMRILEVMNVQGLSVGDLVRHLGKYWMCLKRSSGFDSQPSPVASFQAAQAGYFGSPLKIQPGGREVATASFWQGFECASIERKYGGFVEGACKN